MTAWVDAGPEELPAAAAVALLVPGQVPELGQPVAPGEKEYGPGRCRCRCCAASPEDRWVLLVSGQQLEQAWELALAPLEQQAAWERQPGAA